MIVWIEFGMFIILTQAHTHNASVTITSIIRNDDGSRISQKERASERETIAQAHTDRMRDKRMMEKWCII